MSDAQPKNERTPQEVDYLQNCAEAIASSNRQLDIIMDLIAATMLQRPENRHDTTVIAIIRHVLECLDAVSVLVREGCILPTHPLLRSSFEGVLAVLYIVESNSNLRAAAYIASIWHKQIKYLQRVDPTHELGKALKKELSGDILESQLFAILTPEDCKREVAALEARLRDPLYSAVETERHRMKIAQKKNKSGGDFNWHALFNGPKDIRKLAQHCRMLSVYEVIYRQWSEHGHAGQATHHLRFDRDTVRFRPLRHPEGIGHVLTMAPVHAASLVDRLVQVYAPAEAAFFQELRAALTPKLASLINAASVAWSPSEID